MVEDVYLVPTILKVQQKESQMKKIPINEVILEYDFVVCLTVLISRCEGTSKEASKATNPPKT
jgi:hypothetical protein